MGGDFFQGGGGVEINFCLKRGGYDFTHFPALPPPSLQVIIAQSLNTLKTIF